MTEESQSYDALIEDIRDLSPSAKLVFKTLQYAGNLTQKELAKETHLSPRTVRYATTKLEDNEIITSQISFIDARQRIYSLVPALQETDNNPTGR